MSEQGANGLAPESKEPRPPSMLDAVTPVVALIGFIALSVYLFGLDSTNGALQVGLFTAMTIAGMIAHKNGHSYVALSNAIIGGISSAMGAIFILLAVGALHAAYSQGVVVPTDLSVVGFDDILLASHTVPALTTLRMPIAEIVEEGVRLAIELARDPTASRGAGVTVKQPSLIVRQSTAPPRSAP